MVDNVTSLSRNGVRDWIIQRVTAVVMALYSVVILAYVLSVEHLSYHFWHDVYHNTAVRVLSVLVVLSLVFHAWVGMWTIYTDYIKVVWLRLILQISTILGLMGIVVWSVLILWS